MHRAQVTPEVAPVTVEEWLKAHPPLDCSANPEPATVREFMRLWFPDLETHGGS